MPGVTGRYRLDEALRTFLGADAMRLIRRGDRVIGRYGRLGFVRGRIDDLVVDARWTERREYGWIIMRFDNRYTAAECEYGVDDEQIATGAGRLSRIVRRRKTPSP